MTSNCSVTDIVLSAAEFFDEELKREDVLCHNVRDLIPGQFSSLIFEKPGLGLNYNNSHN